MLDDRQPARGREQRAAGREIEAVRAVAARADDVDVRARRDRGAARELAHPEREAADLLGRLALLPQRDEQPARERGRELAAAP